MSTCLVPWYSGVVTVQKSVCLKIGDPRFWHILRVCHHFPYANPILLGNLCSDKPQILHIAYLMQPHLQMMDFPRQLRVSWRGHNPQALQNTHLLRSWVEELVGVDPVVMKKMAVRYPCGSLHIICQCIYIMNVYIYINNECIYIYIYL